MPSQDRLNVSSYFCRSRGTHPGDGQEQVAPYSTLPDPAVGHGVMTLGTDLTEMVDRFLGEIRSPRPNIMPDPTSDKSLNQYQEPPARGDNSEDPEVQER